MIPVLKSFTFPPAELFAAALESPMIYIDVHENYQKRSFRNKYQVLGPNGIITLSIPLQKGKHQQQNIREVKISYAEDWPRIHRETIRSCYGSAPYFEHYFEGLTALLEARPESLFEYNLTTLDWIYKTQKKKLIWEATAHYIADINKDNKMVKPYPQVFSDRFGFVAGLSMLDLIMNMGPRAASWLNS